MSKSMEKGKKKEREEGRVEMSPAGGEKGRKEIKKRERKKESSEKMSHMLVV